MRHLLIFGLIGPPGSYLCCRFLTAYPPSWLGWAFWIALISFLICGAIDARLARGISAWERVIVAGAAGLCTAAVLHWLLKGNGVVAFAFTVPSMLCSVISTAAKPRDGLSYEEEIRLRH